MANPGNEGIQLAEGIFDYTIADHPHAKEIWRMTQRPDSRIHMQSLLGSGQQPFFGIDLLLSPHYVSQELRAQIEGSTGEYSVALAFMAEGVRGQLTNPNGQQAIDIAAPTGTIPVPDSMAMRYLIGRAIDFTTPAEQTLSLCLVPILDEHYPPLQPVPVMAHITVLGEESVDLLMATVTAKHVLIEWPNHAPQHGWFDERHFPVQWSWTGHNAQGGTVAHEFQLSRSAWHHPA